MYTRCPECNTVFRVSPDQLGAADGRVRCGQCRTVFDARAHLLEKPPGAAGRSSGEYDDVNIEALLKSPEGQEEEEPPPPPRPAAPRPRPAPAPEPPQETLEQEGEPELPPVLAGPAPRRRPSAWATLLWSLLSLVLLALLLGQYAYRNREVLARYPELRPWVEQLCTGLGCTLPPQRDLAAIELLSRNIGPDPDHDHALLITARLRNRARFAQPYPDVVITLRDLQGKVVATRLFTPAEYLPETAAGPFRPGATARLKLAVVDPGPGAVSYQFSFH